MIEENPTAKPGVEPTGNRPDRVVPLKTRIWNEADMSPSEKTTRRESGAVHDHQTVLSAKESPSGSPLSTLASVVAPLVATVRPERLIRSAKLSLAGGVAVRIRNRKGPPEPAYPETAK